MNREMTQTQRQQICLQFMNKLYQMQQAKHLCDLVLELRNQKFYAHKVVVAAWSPAIYNLLSAGQNMTEIIRVQYDNTEIFGSFLFFLYSGEVDEVAEDNLIQVLHLATSLQVNDLRQICEETLKRQVHIANIISTYHVARKFRLPNLEEYALNYMQMNLPEAVKQADFLSLSPPRFNAFLSSGWVCVMKPEVKLFLIISWLGYDVKDRQQYLVLLLRYIDWSTVANDFLNEISQTENFFTTNESSLYLLLQTLFSSMIPLGPYTDSFPALREKYAYLLEHIVQHSYVLPVEVEEYFPVSFQLASVLTETRLGISSDFQCSHCGNQSDISATGNGKYPQPAEPNICVSLDTVVGESLEHSSVHELSNDSVTASIGLGLKKVSIMESQTMPADNLLCHDMSETSNKIRRKSTRVGIKRVASLSEANKSTSLLDNSFLSKPTNLSKVQSSSKKRLKRTLKPELKASLENAMNKALPTKRGKKVEAATVDEPTSAKVKVKFNDTVSRKLVTLQSETVRCEQATASNITQGSERPRRRAASKFCIPKKLVPCQHKTRAVLKAQTFVREIGGKVEEDEGSDVNEIEGKFSAIGVITGDHDLSNQTIKEIDSNSVQKETSSVKASKKAAITENVLNRNSSDSKFSHKTLNKFTSKKRTELNSVLRGILTDSESFSQQKQKEGKEKLGPNTQGALSKRKCRECEYCAPTQRRLANHMERVHGSRAILFVCSVCHFECKWNKRFYEHMKEHFSGPPYMCDFEGCEWQAERIQELLSHRRRHTDERPHKCPHCTARFKTRNNLIAHFKCHSEDKDHECPVCHRRFRMKNTMEQHLVTHSDLRPYLCDTCGFSTKFQSHLISHKRIHTGEVFRCGFPKCNYSSPKRSQLKAHMRSHLNIRHHICHICEKSFVEKSHLVRHVKIHQDLRPHQCDQCEYSSTRIDKVNEHRRKYHSQDASNSKRQYKYTPRGKKGEKKKKAIKSKPAVAVPISATSIINASIGRPIQPKKAVVPTPCPTPFSLAALASAAEEISLRLPDDPTDVNSKLNGRLSLHDAQAYLANGNVDSLETIGSQGRVQIEVICAGGGACVKGESAGNLSFSVNNGMSRISDQIDNLTMADSGRIVVINGTPDQLQYHENELGKSLNLNQGRSIVVDQRTKKEATDQSESVIPSSSVSCDFFQQHKNLLCSTVHSSHASAALLQQLAMSASSAGISQCSRPQTVGDLNHSSTCLLQATLPDMETPSHILSAVQQHNATVSAADSLASLSYQGGQPLLLGQSDSSTQSHQQMLQNCRMPAQQQHCQQPFHQQMMSHQHQFSQQQQQSAENQEQGPGLNAFMVLL